MAKILQFKPKIKTTNKGIDHNLDVARELMNSLVRTLNDYGYEIKYGDDTFKDLGIIYNLLYAMMLRQDGKEHSWHEMMNEILSEMNKRKDDDKT